MTDKTIWLFKEQRSGSSILAETLCRELSLNYVFVENFYQHLPKTQRISRILKRTPEDTDTASLLHTHLFEATTVLSKYQNPIVLRCSRKNKFEQFLSWLTVKESDWNFFHLTKDNILNQNQIFEELCKRKIVVKKSDFDKFTLLHYSHEKFWKVAESYPNQVIYYEDIITGTIDIDILNLYNLKLNSNNYIKNPDTYKKDIFVNYDEVQTWFSTN